MDPHLADLNQAAERIWEACSPTWPELDIEVRATLGSTNTELMARGRRGENRPSLLVAAQQSAGRGRHGRSWLAQTGDSLTFSLGLPLRLDAVPGGGSALSLAVGLAVAEALDAGLHAQQPLIGLKWPNDLWLGQRKLGGILIEATPASGLADDQRWVVIGLGLNVRGEPASPGATTLLNAPPQPDDGPAMAALTPGQVWHWLAPALLRAVHRFEQHGFAPLQAAYARRDVLLGQPVGLWTQAGLLPEALALTPPSERGQAMGVDPHGALLVHTDAGLRAWSSGEVSVRLHAN